ncbi:hypothetical protein U1763_02610 [Sphingomonas sp. LB2R24]|uniref:hypothetical protein n=1 Tax=Sphingomonas sorbitolis TaxID=3096165 RepID=UPI002FC63D2B
MHQDDEIQALHSIHHAAVALIAPGNGTRGFSLRTMSGVNRTIFLAMKDEVRSTRQTILTLIYDTIQPAPSLKDVWLMRPAEDPDTIARGDDLDLFIQCRLWAPVNGKRVVVVGPDQFDGHFAVSDDGARFEARPGKPVKDLTRGAVRASARIARLAASRSFVPTRGASVMISA